MVAWSPAILYPGLGRGQQLVRTRSLPPRAPVLDRNEAPLAEVVAQLAEKHKVPILLDQRALQAVGVEANAPSLVRRTELHWSRCYVICCLT